MNIFLDHIVLNVENVDDAVKFYSDVIGFESERLPEYRSGKAPFPSMRINEHTLIDVFPPSMWRKNGNAAAAKSNLNHFCLTLEYQDWLNLIERLKSNGVEIHRGPTNNWGAKGLGVSIYFYDVDGNEIEARYYEQ